MRLRLQLNILMRLRLWLRLLPYWIARQNFLNKLKFKYMLKLPPSFDSVRFVLLKIWTEWVIICLILCHFKFLTMINIIVGAGDVGAGATSRYGSGSGSDQLMRLLAAPCGSSSGSGTLVINIIQANQYKWSVFYSSCVKWYLSPGPFLQCTVLCITHKEERCMEKNVKIHF
jgi:hypothetical protein